MLSFQCDYAEGALEEILEKLVATNRESSPGYGADEYTARAKEKIKAACACPQGDVYFVTGGTEANQVVISSMLAPYEGVLSAETGHINVHESGAIEATGHKVLALPQSDGKVAAADVKAYLERFYGDETYEHMVFPGMVYISHPTEYGTLYSLAELEALSTVCRDANIPLYMDGARLGYGVMSSGTDVTMADVARLCDVFYIGGTKVGALFGEAIVFTQNNTPKHFMTRIKQRSALLAKGRMLGIQFDVLFTDDLYFKASRHAIQMADKLRSALREKGYEFFIDSPTNQLFVVMENDKLDALKKSVNVSTWEKKDENHTVVRFVTSWATEEAAIEQLKALL